MFWTTIRQLFLTYSEQIRDSKHWWHFLAKWTLQYDTSSIPCQKMMVQLEVVKMEKSLLSVVKHVGHPYALGRIFGSSLTQGGSIVLCHTSSLPGDCLVGCIARVGREKLDHICWSRRSECGNMRWR